MIYLDATFLAKFYLREAGSQAVVEIIERNRQLIFSSVLGRMEAGATFHRKLREKEISSESFQGFHRQLEEDIEAGRISWHPISPSIVSRVTDAFLTLPSTTFLRTGDAIHLATAAECGFKEIYSNDRHLLAAAPLFKLKGVNPLR